MPASSGLEAEDPSREFTLDEEGLGNFGDSDNGLEEELIKPPKGGDTSLDYGTC